MKATIYFKLSAEGQKDALRRNLPAAIWQKIEGEIEERDLELMTINADGTMLAVTSYMWADGSDKVFASAFGLTSTYYSAPADASIEISTVPSSVRDILDRMHALRDAAEAKRKAGAEKAERNNAERRAEQLLLLNEELKKMTADPTYLPTNHYGSPISYALQTHKDHPIVPLLDARAKEKTAAEHAAKAAKEAAETAKEQAKVEYIATWVKEHGTETQKARLSEDLLPRKEAVDAIADAAFTPLTGLEKATYPKPDCSAGDEDGYDTCENCEVEHDIADAESLTGEQYTSLATIRSQAQASSQFPATVSAVVMQTWHDCEHDDCKRGEKPAAKVSLVVGPFTFVRYYAI